MIRCNECDGIMKRAKLFYPTIQPYGMSRKRHISNYIIFKGRKHYMPVSYLDDETLVICSNFPRCSNHYIMKKHNFKKYNKSTN